MSELGKVFNDPIHGHIELHPLLVKIIDTPQFQRLRNIKQLGGVYFVYPGASHNRFEHSLGVAYLAGEFAQALKQKQPELNITDEDILCVQIAGLCHDLGHGPFSHLYDNMFLPRARPGEKWKHESLSVDMFDHLVKCNGLEEEMKKHNLQLPKDMTFIKEMIRGPTLNTQGEEWPYKGREKEKSFLYEIVANNRNDIDVDKFDYFARDCHHLGIKISFDHQRFFAFARVCKDEHNERQICSRDKEKDNLYDLFLSRSTLHRKAYQHKVTKLIQTMITEAFIKADPYIQIEGSGGRMFTLSTAVDDMKAYTKLTDQVFDLILTLPSQDQPATAEGHQDPEDAKKILNRILHRDLYKFVGETKRTSEKPTQEEISSWKEELAQANPEGNAQDDGLTAEDFEIVVTTVDYGKKVEDLISKVSFYRKSEPDKPFKEKEASSPSPEQVIRVYLKKNDEKSLRAATRHFIQWCNNRGFPVLKIREEN